MNDRITRVILVRHGQSTYNAQKLYQGCSDDAFLTEKGRLEAYKTGIALSNIAIDAVYTSPLRRTKETAREILAAIDAISNRRLNLEIDANLKEIDLPAWQGLPFKYVRENFAEDYRIWRETPHQFQMIEKSILENNLSIATASKELQKKSKIQNLKSKIEPYFPILNLYEQAQKFWQEILPLHTGKTILLVSHGGTIRALLSTAVGIESDRYHVFQQSNCGISILNFPQSEDRSARLEAMNLTNHLGEVLPKLKDGKEGLRLLLVPSDNGQLLDTQKLALLLQKIPLDFCLNSDAIDSQVTADLLLQSQTHPTVHLEVSRKDFLLSWHHFLQTWHQKRSLSLTTGLVIAGRSTIESALSQILGKASFNLQKGTMSILHYPTSTNLPILQTLNFSQLKISDR